MKEHPVSMEAEKNLPGQSTKDICVKFFYLKYKQVNRVSNQPFKLLQRVRNSFFMGYYINSKIDIHQLSHFFGRIIQRESS